MKFFVILVILVQSICFAVSPSIDESNKSSDGEAVLSLIQRAESQLDRSPQYCGQGDLPSGGTCSFKNLCQRYAGNEDAQYLYVDQDGRKIPNFQNLMNRQILQVCSLVQQSKDPTKLAVKMMGKVAKNATEVAELQKKYLDSISRNKESETLVDYERFIADKSIEDVNDLDPMKEENILQEANKILDAFQSAHVPKFSDETYQNIRKWQAKAYIIEPDEEVLAKYTDDPFQDVRLMSSVKLAGSKEKVLENQKTVQAALDRNVKTFQDTKTRMIQFLQSRKNEVNSREIANMIERLSKIKLEFPDVFSPNVLNRGSCASPNAFYDPTRHTFTLCPQVMDMPENTVQAIIAHELGHSIDPCIMTFDFQSVSGEKDTSMHDFLKNGELSSANLRGDIAFLPNQPKQEPGLYTAFDTEIASTVGLADIRSAKFSVLRPGVPLKSNPFSDEVSCLQGMRSARASMGDSSSQKDIVKYKIQLAKQQGLSEESDTIKGLRQTLNNLDGSLKNKEACSFMAGPRGHSQMQEAFADWISSKVMADKVGSEKDPKQAERIAFETSAFFTAESCSTQQSQNQKVVKEAQRMAGCDGGKAGGLMKDMGNLDFVVQTHPEDVVRVERIFMTDPRVTSALHCKKSLWVKDCE